MEFPPFKHLAAAALLLAFVAGLLYRWRRRSKYDLHRIPGPPTYPIIGNIPQILQWKKPQMHLKVHEWTKKYGKIVKVGLRAQRATASAPCAIVPESVCAPGSVVSTAGRSGSVQFADRRPTVQRACGKPTALSFVLYISPPAQSAGNRL